MAGVVTTILAFMLDLVATAMNQISFAMQKFSHMDTERRK